MDQDNKQPGGLFSKVIRAGRRRTYFFDVRTTRGNDYYITITESKKRFNDDGYDRHKVFLYKEDFNKFVDALSETVNHVKEDLLPEYDFDEFNHEYPEDSNSAKPKSNTTYSKHSTDKDSSFDSLDDELGLNEDTKTEEKTEEKTEDKTIDSDDTSDTTNETPPSVDVTEGTDNTSEEDLKW